MAMVQKRALHIAHCANGENCYEIAMKRAAPKNEAA